MHFCNNPHIQGSQLLAQYTTDVHSIVYTPSPISFSGSLEQDRRSQQEESTSLFLLVAVSPLASPLDWLAGGAE